MITTALALLVVAALLGAFLLSYVLRGKPTPKGVAFVHGPIAAVGLVLLLILAVREHGSMWLPVGIFAVAAAGGVWLIATDLRGTGPSKAGAVIHGLLALGGFGVLLYLVARGP